MRFWLSLFVVVVVASGTARPARADNREEARKEFTAGQQSDKDKDYQAAIEHYLRAYELVPHHFALFNIATAYERLGQLREAAQWFERYLDEAPQSLVKERREVEKLILELKLRPAKLTVKTSPAGARVLIDGQPVGVTPYTRAIRGGGHRVRVELEGQREERDVALEYGEPQSIDVTLNIQHAAPPDRGGGLGTPPNARYTPQTQTSGMLHVTGSPEGALVAIDDQVVGRVGGEFHVEPGSHNLKVTMYGYQGHDQEFAVTTGQQTDVEVQLKAGTSAPPTGGQPLFGYYAGATVGADVRGGGAQYMGEFGYRIMTVDIGLRIGKASSKTTLDVIFRWTVLRTKLAPFIQAGYSAASSGDDSSSSSSSSSLSGYLLGGGLRYDLVRGESSAVSLLAESGVRIIATSTASEEKTLFIPLLASLQVTFGGKTNR